MGKGENKIMRRRLVNAYMSSIISISLVLLLVGFAGMLLFNARAVSDYFKENMKVSVIMKHIVSDDEALAFQGSLENERFVKSATFISRQQGEQELVEMLGEDFLDVLESSPVPVSIEMTLDAAYVSSDSLDVVRKEIESSPLVDEVSYQKSLIDALNSNFTRISAVLAVFIALLLFISYVLINNTVRLSVFARRFTIHTMKLVGATRAFIRAPFLVHAALQGLVSAILANLALFGVFAFLKNRFEQLSDIFSVEALALVMLVVIAVGLLICVVSTCFVVNKLVAMRKDDLYY